MVHNLNLLERASIFFGIDKTIYTTFLTSNASVDLTSWIQNFIKNSFCSKFWYADNVPSLRRYYLNPLLYLSLFLLFFFISLEQRISVTIASHSKIKPSTYMHVTLPVRIESRGVSLPNGNQVRLPVIYSFNLFVNLIEQNIFGIFVIFVQKNTNFSPLFSSD